MVQFPVFGDKGVLLPPDTEDATPHIRDFLFSADRNVSQSECPSCIGHFLSNFKNQYAIEAHFEATIILKVFFF